ncbi:hypothetical protein [Buttiauxella]|jgi:hypothetical protein|uniref:Phage protein n=1 Tax=Buttiauxella ferragutiae ATCC 51602 TaxID=1354252 RepID=A0ABX2W5D0_9ENTR|nr:hypothetical protein [Buttiauxella]MCE0824730.1 hypothetical protein [Buttiauxella ferragutiae]OAT25999.1 hypothetical protein M976_03291 [Buttiauxella ferragutiae ATCC 51602]TDN54237.1 hypothetical protein EC843_101278 [Buttiauxella sp. JUb87]UNK59288.1 hypothetical protein MNO13_12755 [Buttiauxella ferragutiae]
MEKYVFYVKDEATKIFARSALSKDDIKKLKQDGFKKYPLEFEAESKQEAIDKLNENTRDNMDSLGGFSATIAFIALTVVIMAVLVYLF